MIIEFTGYKKIERKINEETTLQVYQYFVNNPDTWVKGKELEEELELTSIRSYINNLRNKGIPIISSKNGYKITRDKEEIKKCYSKLRNRGLRILTSAKLMKKNNEIEL